MLETTLRGTGLVETFRVYGGVRGGLLPLGLVVLTLSPLVAARLRRYD